MSQPLAGLPILVLMLSAMAFGFTLAIVLGLARRRGPGPGRALPPAPPSETSRPAGEEIHRLIATGRKIEAIKVYREQTGCGLKEAKDAIDAIGAGHRG